MDVKTRKGTPLVSHWQSHSCAMQIVRGDNMAKYSRRQISYFENGGNIYQSLIFLSLAVSKLRTCTAHVNIIPLAKLRNRLIVV